MKFSILKFEIKEKIFNLFPIRLGLSLLILISGYVYALKKNEYKSAKYFCWILRISNVKWIKKICCVKVHDLVKKIMKKNSNPILDGFLKSSVAENLRTKYEHIDDSVKRSIMGNLLALKDYNPMTDEKGVLILTYTDYFKDFVINYNLYDVAQRYYIVLEPSWTGYSNPHILMFVNNIREIIIQCPEVDDFQFIKSLNCNLLPVKFGASEWVDLEIFRPLKGINKEFDIIYVANWASYKKHRELFKALKVLKRRGQKLSVLLLGFDYLGSKEDIVNECRYFGVQNMCTILDRVSPQDVNLYLNKSKASILLSRKEGSCRAISESLAAGTPVILYRHNIGGAANAITKDTGILCDYSELPDAMVTMAQQYEKFNPRKWAEENIGYVNTTKKLNTILRGIALKNKEPWTKDILYKTNSPNLVLKSQEKDLVKTST